MTAAIEEAAGGERRGTRLPSSWNDGPAPGALLGFVVAVTDPKSRDRVAAADRVATFDDDGERERAYDRDFAQVF